MLYAIQTIHHLMLISRGCAWLSMKRGGCKFGGSKTGAVLCPKRGAVVSQFVFSVFFNCMFYQLLRVQLHSCSSTQSWGSGLPSIVAPFSFRIGIWDIFVHRGQKSYTPTAFGKLWTTPGVRCMQHASS